MDGSTSAASNGISMSPTVSINAVEDAAIVFVCGGLEIEKAATPALIAKLKQFDEDRIPLGSLCTGGYCLAVAGLLNRYEAVVHWEQKVP
jgi:transcriptional regulator GlxA family with amidase domain